MGEVYRADDLSLGQSVALKFLPQKFARDADRLQRLRSEVKTARQVAHPNVCRVYDLGEADGQLFISMEYVDGRDLGALLAQINRLPEERGVEITRQLCLGLGAIHDRGLLHRDLKPANVMLDGRGQVRITDFGLAAPAEGLRPEDIRDGTPGYQSPEQLAGREVTTRSDIYALGLILYELFTGKRPFTATERAELARIHAEDPPSRPSIHVSGLSPAIERIILKCLEKEPRDRPRTAYEVLAALPGGDPLQAALAAGQTPSPAVVADAKVEGSLHPLIAMTLLAATLTGIALAVALGSRTRLVEMMPHQRSPHDLANQARDMIRQFGYADPPRDVTYGLATNKATLSFLKERDHSADRWNPLATGQPPGMFFWYRQSPEWMQPLDRESTELHSHHGQASADNPAFTTPGMVRICLDLEGRLIEFQAVPIAEPSKNPIPLDWPKILHDAGLSKMSAADSASVGWAPPLFVDEWLTWRGVYAEAPDIPVRADAGLREGRLVFFHSSAEYERTKGLALFAESQSSNPRGGARRQYFAVVLVLFLTGGFVLAWHNVRVARANLRGTAILGGLCFTALSVAWLFSAHHVLDLFDELELLQIELGHGAWVTAQLCMYYLALEPFARRRWPWRMVGWNRLLIGRWRDPLVGRDVLLGAAAGATVAAIWLAADFIPQLLGHPLEQPNAVSSLLLTAGPVFGLAQVLVTSVGASLADFLFFFAFYVLTRRQWLAAILFVCFFLSQKMLSLSPEENLGALLTLDIIYSITTLIVIMRSGLLSLAAAYITTSVLLLFPVTFDMTAWYSGNSLVYLAVLVGLVLYGFILSSGGQAMAWVGHLTGEANTKAEVATG